MDLHALTDQIEEISGLYSKKFGIHRDPDWYILKLQEELGELIQSYLMMVGKGRAKGLSEEELKKNFHREVADVFCHTLLLAKGHGVDLKTEIDEKWLKWG